MHNSNLLAWQLGKRILWTIATTSMQNSNIDFLQKLKCLYSTSLNDRQHLHSKSLRCLDRLPLTSCIFICNILTSFSASRYFAFISSNSAPTALHQKENSIQGKLWFTLHSYPMWDFFHLYLQLQHIINLILAHPQLSKWTWFNQF